MSYKETATIAFRVDKETKEEAEALFDQLGLSMGSALNMFLKQSVHDWRIPFQSDAGRKFRKHLEMACKEADDIISGKKKTKSYNNAQELWDDL